MGGVVRGLLRMFEVTRLPLSRDLAYKEKTLCK